MDLPTTFTVCRPSSSSSSFLPLNLLVSLFLLLPLLQTSLLISFRGSEEEEEEQKEAERGKGWMRGRDEKKKIK